MWLAGHCLSALRETQPLPHLLQDDVLEHISKNALLEIEFETVSPGLLNFKQALKQARSICLRVI